MDAADKARTVAEREAAAAALLRAERGSLQALLDAYCASLEGRQSHDDAAGCSACTSPGLSRLAAMPAATIKAEQFRDVLARLIDAGKGRTAAKLRAYCAPRFRRRCGPGWTRRFPPRFPRSESRSTSWSDCRACRSSAGHSTAR